MHENSIARRSSVPTLHCVDITAESWAGSAHYQLLCELLLRKKKRGLTIYLSGFKDASF